MNNLCLHNLETQITKMNLQIMIKNYDKNYCSFCQRTNHSISACFEKQQDDEDKNDAHAQSKSPPKLSVQYFRSPSNDRTKRYDTRYRSRSNSRNNYYNEKNSQNRYCSTSRDRFNYDKILLLHNIIDHDITNTNEIHDPIVLLIDLLTDLLTDITLVINIDHAHIQEITTILQGTHLNIDHLQDQEFLDFLDLVHIQIQGTNLIQYNHNTTMTQLTLKYTSITQLK